MLSNIEKKAIAYVRVSTEEQAREGVSVDAQIARIKAYCEMRSLPLVEVIVDAGVSAAKPLATRHGGQKILDSIRCGKASVVIAVKLDRLFRSCVDCLETTQRWDAAGVALHLIDLGDQAVDTSSAMGRFALTVMAGAAELELNKMRERTKAAMNHKKAIGQSTGTPPYGFQVGSDGKTLVENRGEQEVIDYVHDGWERGLSMRAIVAELHLRGVVGRTGKPLALTQVANILKASKLQHSDRL